jgi:hypothetical protein
MSEHPASRRPLKIPLYIWGIMAVGVLLRLLHLFYISYAAPFHLGGLFYEFSRQILLDHFAFPATIPYYAPGGIPFLYPPLPFYLQALVMGLFAPPPFLTVNLLPPIIAAFSLPLFYWMARQATDDSFVQAVAMLAFALMPSAFVNQIEGAGLAEACGTLALLAYLGWLFRFDKTLHPLHAVWAGLFLGLCVLASPGSAYGAVIISVVFFFKVLGLRPLRTAFKGAGLLLLTGLTGLVVSAPYWLVILGRSDLGIFLNTFLTQHAGSALVDQVRYFITFKPADMITFIGDEGVYGFLLDWLVLAGLVWAVLNRKVSLVVLFFAIWLVPREGLWMVAIPAALLAGLGFVQLVVPLFRKAFQAVSPGGRPPLAPGVLGLVLVISLGAAPLLAIHDLLDQAELKFTPAEVAELEQAQAFIPADARILVAGDGALREWTPALLQREVLNCEFGLEWKPVDLQQVGLINAALFEDDLAKAMGVVRDYSGDTSLWLVADPDRIDALVASAAPGYQVVVREQTPELVFAVVQAK